MKHMTVILLGLRTLPSSGLSQRQGKHNGSLTVAARQPIVTRTRQQVVLCAQVHPELEAELRNIHAPRCYGTNP